MFILLIRWHGQTTQPRFLTLSVLGQASRTYIEMRGIPLRKRLLSEATYPWVVCSPVELVLSNNSVAHGH